MSNKNFLTENEKIISSLRQFENADTLSYPVEYAAKLFPRNTALRYMGLNISYKTLAKNITRYADAFADMGLGDGEAVTIALPNIPESVYLLYGAAKRNLRLSPLHPLSTPDAIKSAMQKSGSRIVFTLADAAPAAAKACPFAAVVAVSPANSLRVKKILYSLKNHMPKQNGNLFLLKNFLKRNMTMPSERKNCPASPTSNILLQSGGTTGIPKVIGLSALSVNNLSARGLGILGRKKVTDCGMLSVLPIFHGFGLAMGVHPMLCHGGKIVLMPKFHRAGAIKEIRKGNIQFVIGVPRLYEALLSHKKFDGKSLRYLVAAFVGGDFVPHTLLRAFDKKVADCGGTCRLHEGYGLTETVTVCSVNTASANKDATVGKPLKDIEIAAYDFSSDTPVKLEAGQKGELAVCGNTLMEEYVADPDGTNHVFFSSSDRKWVRTGDLGYVDEDGFVHFISRLKRIVKIHGVPVYPLEIEQLVSEAEGVTGVCAVADSDGKTEESIILFVESENKSLKESLRPLIREKISVYAEPKDIVIVPSLPLTNVSKIDTKALMKAYKEGKKKNLD